MYRFLTQPLSRTAKVNTLWLMLLGAGAAVVLLVGLLFWGGDQTKADTQRLTMFCAAGMMVPVEEIVASYEKEYGITVELQPGGSNDLLNKLQVNRNSSIDLYLAADDFYTDKAVEDGLAAETLPIAHQRPVVVVLPDNPKNIAGIADLLREDVTVAIANPDGAAIGRAVKKRLDKVVSGDGTLWSKLEERVTTDGVLKPTVNEVASDVKLKSVDAAIVWDSTAAMPNYRDYLKVITASELDGDPNLVSIAVLKSSKQPTAALKFARYLSARDKGLPIFKKYGTRPVEGDLWADRPQVNFYCGAVNRLAVDELVDEFEQREDVEVNTTYLGCGTLTGQMSTFVDQRTDLGFPDVYMACDVYYLENVRDWFQEAANVSDVEIVIAVPKNSDKVKSLADLVKPGVRVAVGEPEMCTIGVLTRQLLQREGLYQQLKSKQQTDGEVVVEKVSSAMLVPDVASSSVDATVAYISDVLANPGKVDFVRIDSPLNRAVQPFSIAKSSQHKHLMRRLFIKVASSPEAFEDAGFNFRLDKPSPSPTESAARQ